MLVTRIGFDVFSDNTPRSVDADSPPAICRLRLCEPESLPIRRKTKGSVSARFNERLLVMVVVNAQRRAQGDVANQVLRAERRTSKRDQEGCSIETVVSRSVAERMYLWSGT